MSIIVQNLVLLILAVISFEYRNDSHLEYALYAFGTISFSMIVMNLLYIRQLIKNKSPFFVALNLGFDWQIIGIRLSSLFMIIFSFNYGYWGVAIISIIQVIFTLFYVHDELDDVEVDHFGND